MWGKYHRCVRNRPYSKVIACIVAFGLVAAACGNDERPSVNEWRAQWQGAMDGLPTSAALGQPPERTLCRTTLGHIRELQGDLLPTPDAAIDGTVSEWLRVAEDAFFECPPSSAELPSMAAAYGELDRLAAEINVVLSIDQPSE